MGHGKKYKSKRQLKKDMPQNKLMEMGLIRKAKWTDELGDRSWKEGPFRNRAVETWNGDKTVYKGSKTNIPGQREWTNKKSVEKGSWGFGIDGKEVEVEGAMKRKYNKSGNVVKEKFRASSSKDRKMFRKIDRNEKKLK